MNLRNWFDRTVSSGHNEIGLEWAGKVYTFGDIDARSNRMARALEARGLSKGDRLCVYLSNSIEMIDVYLACVKLGVIFVPINILYRDREMSHILGDAEPSAVVSDTDIECSVPIWRPAELTMEAGSLPNARPELTLDGDAPAGIIYTSG